MPRMKRLLWKASLLALAVNGIFLMMLFQKQGRLTPHDYLAASESLATTVVFLGVIAFIFSRLSKGRRDESP